MWRLVAVVFLSSTAVYKKQKALLRTENIPNWKPFSSGSEGTNEHLHYTSHVVKSKKHAVYSENMFIRWNQDNYTFKWTKMNEIYSKVLSTS